MISICCVTDEKPGHKSQIEGLVDALGELQRTQVQWISVGQSISTTISPDLIIAAGHKTHIPALLLKWRFSGKLVVLMKPSLPRFLFDLCIIAQHDGVKDSRRVFTTQGAINAVQPGIHASDKEGLILIGGPSKHYNWSDNAIVDQLIQLKSLYPDITWILSTSRRTPESFISACDKLLDKQFNVIPFQETDRQWLLEHYQKSGLIWVSEDSVSMVYEALSSGARVGILEVPRVKISRVSRGLNQLVGKNFLMTLSQVPDKKSLQTIPEPLQEAKRAATYIVSWLSE